MNHEYSRYDNVLWICLESVHDAFGRAIDGERCWVEKGGRVLPKLHNLGIFRTRFFQIDQSFLYNIRMDGYTTVCNLTDRAKPRNLRAILRSFGVGHAPVSQTPPMSMR